MIQNIAIIRTLSSPSLITKANPTETTITRRNANRGPRKAADMGLEYAENASLSQKQGLVPFLTLLLPLQPTS
jgi:hypothetical protein